MTAGFFPLNGRYMRQLILVMGGDTEVKQLRSGNYCYWEDKPQVQQLTSASLPHLTLVISQARNTVVHHIPLQRWCLETKVTWL